MKIRQGIRGGNPSGFAISFCNVYDESAQAGLDKLPELALQDGDSIDVPRKPGTVSVLGAVFQSNSFIYQRERTVADYLALAGGPFLFVQRNTAHAAQRWYDSARPCQQATGV